MSSTIWLLPVQNLILLPLFPFLFILHAQWLPSSRIHTLGPARSLYGKPIPPRFLPGSSLCSAPGVEALLVKLAKVVASSIILLASYQVGAHEFSHLFPYLAPWGYKFHKDKELAWTITSKAGIRWVWTTCCAHHFLFHLCHKWMHFIQHHHLPVFEMLDNDLNKTNADVRIPPKIILFAKSALKTACIIWHLLW